MSKDNGFTTIRVRVRQQKKLNAIKVLKNCDKLEDALDFLLREYKKNSKKDRNFELLGF